MLEKTIEIQKTIDSILIECDVHELSMLEQKAYVLATTQWETAHTFKPVKEAFWLNEGWRERNLKRYYPYYGRGYVQLTWKKNYEKYADIMQEDLVNDPDLALLPEIALFILCHGFKHGVFTGHTLEQWVSSHGIDYMNARRCINGVDKALEIADLAEEYFEEIS